MTPELQQIEQRLTAIRLAFVGLSVEGEPVTTLQISAILGLIDDALDLIDIEDQTYELVHMPEMVKRH